MAVFSPTNRYRPGTGDWKLWTLGVWMLSLLLFHVVHQVDGECFSHIKLITVDSAPNAELGSTQVAMWDNIIVIGSPGPSLSTGGSVFVFTETMPGVYDQITELFADGKTYPTNDFRFGFSVAIWNNIIVVGAFRDNSFGAPSGAVDVFTESTPGTYDRIDNIVPDDAESGDLFGYAVAIADNVIVVGATGESDPLFQYVSGGSVFVFTETTPGTYTQVAKLIANERTRYDELGSSVAISNNIIVSGMPGDDGVSPTSYYNEYGAVLVFAETTPGTYAQVAKLVADDPVVNNQFGFAVAIWNNIIIAGSPHDDDFGAMSGSAFVFTETTPGTYTQVAKLLASDASFNDKFGSSVTIWNNLIVVGSPLDSDAGAASGSAYIFTEISPGTYDQVAKLIANDASMGHRFGSSVALSNANNIVILSPLHDISGAAYVFPADCWVVIDNCMSSPCLNDGVCASDDGFTCDCSGTGFEGDICQTDVDECVSDPCQNGGTCTDAGTLLFACACAGTGFEGDTCSEDADDCASSPCLNDGSCSDAGMNLFECACASGWDGDTCSIDIDDCASSPCLNDGACSDTGANSYACDCTGTGFDGLRCFQDIDDCLSSPCEHGAPCLDRGVNQYECNCTNTGFEGDLCNSDVDDCLSSPCFNNGVCKDTGANIFSCDCSTSPGFTGNLCESDIDDCVSDPCMNDGSCQDEGTNKFKCNCTGTGFQGNLCQTDIDDCVSSPCMNGGFCTNDNVPNSYSCDCNGTGFAGSICESDVNDCLSSPCLNDSTCVDTGAHSFECNCLKGYTGSTCDADLDDCLSNPCQNDGTCVDVGLNAYECECLSTHTGQRCESLSPTDEPPPTTDVHVPVTIIIDIPAFVNDTADSFANELQQTILPEAIGGTPSDYVITIVEQPDGSYEVTIVTTNPSGRDSREIEETIAANPKIKERVDGEMTVTAYEETHSSSAHHLGHCWAAMRGMMFVLVSMVLLM